MTGAAAFAAAVLVLAQGDGVTSATQKVAETFEQGCIQPFRQGSSVAAAATRLGLTSLNQSDPDKLKQLTGVELRSWRAVSTPSVGANLVYQSSVVRRTLSRIESCALWLSGPDARVVAEGIEDRLSRAAGLSPMTDLSSGDVSWRDYGSYPEGLGFVSFKSDEERVYITLSRVRKSEAATADEAGRRSP